MSESTCWEYRNSQPRQRRGGVVVLQMDGSEEGWRKRRKVGVERGRIMVSGQIDRHMDKPFKQVNNR